MDAQRHHLGFLGGSAHLAAVLQRCGHRINGPGNAAEILGLNPSMLRSRLKKLGIRRA